MEWNVRRIAINKGGDRLNYSVLLCKERVDMRRLNIVVTISTKNDHTHDTHTHSHTQHIQFFVRHNIKMHIHAIQFRKKKNKFIVWRLSLGIRCVIFTPNWKWMFTCVGLLRVVAVFFPVASDSIKLCFDVFFFLYYFENIYRFGLIPFEL